jgi:hypothetical protein
MKANRSARNRSRCVSTRSPILPSELCVVLGRDMGRSRRTCLCLRRHRCTNASQHCRLDHQTPVHCTSPSACSQSPDARMWSRAERSDFPRHLTCEDIESPFALQGPPQPLVAGRQVCWRSAAEAPNTGSGSWYLCSGSTKPFWEPDETERKPIGRIGLGNKGCPETPRRLR